MKLKIFGLEMPMKSKVAGMKSAIRVESALILIEEEIVTVTA